MSEIVTVNLRSLLELHLESLAHPVPVRVALHSRNEPPRIAVRSEEALESDIFINFSDPAPFVAFTLLAARTILLKGSDTDLPIIDGASADTLVNALADKSSPLARLLISDDPRSLLRRAFAGQTCVSAFSESFLNKTEFAFVCDGQEITDASQMMRIVSALAQWRDPSSSAVMPELLSRRHSVVDEMKHVFAQVPTRLLEFSAKKLNDIASAKDHSMLTECVGELSTKELFFHLRQDTCIELLEGCSDFKVTFTFDLINASFVPLLHRSHQFWFQLPQVSPVFQVRNEDGGRMDYECVKDEAQFRQIRVKLPRPIGPMERVKYTVAYVVKGDASDSFFFSVSPRTPTKELSLSVRGYEGLTFADTRVEVESDSGHIKDTVPDIVSSEADGVQTIGWREHNSKPGELYRTVWRSAAARRANKRSAGKSKKHQTKEANESSS